jgi:hypothetical protein
MQIMHCAAQPAVKVYGDKALRYVTGRRDALRWVWESAVCAGMWKVSVLSSRLCGRSLLSLQLFKRTRPRCGASSPVMPEYQPEYHHIMVMPKNKRFKHSGMLGTQ